VLPDHPTPICKKTHTTDPVPFVLYDRTRESGKESVFTENAALRSGVFIEEGYTLLGRLLNKAG
jgi:2,3-bisphosphoglycerate-independent phosphoglycerate mutase